MTKKENIEVEIRGLIAADRVEDLVSFLSRNGELKESKRRVLIDYSTFLPQEGVRDRKKDIRLRITNDVPEIIIKLGKWGGSENRKEISLLASKGEFDKLVQIFGAIGLEKGVLCVRNSRVFDFKGVEFAIVEVPGHSHYFEAEKMIGENDDADETKRSITDVCRELELIPFEDKEFYEYIEKLNKEANEIFDFKDYTENYFKKRFDLKSV